MIKIISKTQLLMVILMLVFAGCQKQEITNPIDNSELNVSNPTNFKGISTQS